MKTIKAVVLGMGLAALSAAGVAQEEEAPESFVYATYFSCPGGSLAEADELIAEDADRMDGLVEDGTLQSWGYWAHHTGGWWQRLYYHQADSLQALLDGGDAIQATADDDDEAAESEDAGPEFGEICNWHEDYIWQVDAGNPGSGEGEASFSVYHVCDINREERADEIVKEHVGPVMDKMMEEGKLTSWGWLSHVVGGEFRKVHTMRGADQKSLLAARSAAIEAIYGEDDEVGAEFSDICGPHTDYMWNIVH